jgi:3-(3-hydroxy-phenyl)propionate hydroxylase
VSHVYDVAIVGAGPVGLTLANLLGLAGLRVVLIERHEGTVQEPRAVSIDDESLRTMQAAGLVEAVCRDVALDYGSHYFGRRGGPFVRIEPTTREYGFPRRSAFTQPKLEATLKDGLARFAAVEPLFSHVCDGFIQDHNGVDITVAGADGTRVIRAAYLVGCDGARSQIRKAIGATLSGSTYSQPWLIVDLAATRERLRQTRVCCDPNRPYITLPGPNGIRRYEFMLHDGEDEEAIVAPDAVRALLAAAGPDADMPVVRRQVYAFHARIADRWRERRVLIAGDAAHLSPPFAGQGMNSGIRDAHNLAWKLVGVIEGRFGTELLDSYPAERVPHARALIDLAVRLGQVMMPTSVPRAWLVQTAFWLLRFAPRLRSYFAEMKYKPKPSYQHGFIVKGDPFGLAGRMLPQPLVERIDRSRLLLDDLLGQDFALLTYGPQAQDALRAASALDFSLGLSASASVRLAILPQHCNPDREGPHLDVTLRDVNGTLAPFLSSDKTMVIIVRPDRYVCGASELADAAQLAALVRVLVANCGPAEQGARDAA